LAGGKVAVSRGGYGSWVAVVISDQRQCGVDHQFVDDQGTGVAWMIAAEHGAEASPKRPRDPKDELGTDAAGGCFRAERVTNL